VCKLCVSVADKELHQKRDQLSDSTRHVADAKEPSSAVPGPSVPSTGVPSVGVPGVGVPGSGVPDEVVADIDDDEEKIPDWIRCSPANLYFKRDSVIILLV